MTPEYRYTPGFTHLDRIRGTNHKQMRDRTQRREMLDRLMSWSIFTQPNRIVRENINHLHFRKRRETNRRPHVIGERQERSAIRNQTTVERDTRERRSHRVLAHTEMQDAAVVRFRLETVAR